MLSRVLPGSQRARIALLLVVAGGVAGGILVGRAYAYSQSVGGLTAAFSGVVFVFAIAGLAAFGIAAIIAARVLGAPRGTAGRAFRTAALALVLGFAIGVVTAEATGGTYREPVVLESQGATNAEITLPGADFVPRADGRATCATVPDGTQIGSITALDLGELAGGTLRGVVFWMEGSTSTRIELYIDGSDVPDGPAPVWTDVVEDAEVSADRRSGSARFDRASLVEPGPPLPQWHGDIAGAITWTCEAPS